MIVLLRLVWRITKFMLLLPINLVKMLWEFHTQKPLAGKLFSRLLKLLVKILKIIAALKH